MTERDAGVLSLWTIFAIIIGFSVLLGVALGLLGDAMPGWLRGGLIGGSTSVFAVILMRRRQKALDRQRIV